MDNNHDMTKRLSLSFSQKRIDKEMTTAELANSAGVALDTVEAIECNNMLNINIADFLKMANSLDCKLKITFNKKDNSEATDTSTGA